MGRPRVQHKCKDCGQPCPPRGRWDGGFRCVQCAIKRHQESARQINARRGEYYEKWVVGLEAAVQRAKDVIAAYDDQQDRDRPA